MRGWIIAGLTLLTAACAASFVQGQGQVVGQLEHPALTEASGFARSRHAPGRYWLLNDRGNEPLLYALEESGTHLASLRPAIERYGDWEDLDTAVIDGVFYLVIADIGDNAGARESILLHLIAEPSDLGSTDEEAAVPVTQTLEFRYPDSARDAESLAVDGDEFYVLSKRTRPPELYRGSLRATGVTTLSHLGAVRSLPVASARELAAAPVTGVYAWQPTAMTFNLDLTRAVILTTRNAYLFERDGEEPWVNTLNRAPRVFALSEELDAEAVTFVDDATFLTTTEKQHAAIFKFAP